MSIFGSNSYNSYSTTTENNYNLELGGAYDLMMEGVDSEHEIIKAMHAYDMAELQARSNYENVNESYVVKEASGNLWEKIKAAFKKIWEAIKKFFERVTMFLRKLFLNAKDFVKKYESKIKSAIKDHGTVDVGEMYDYNISGFEKAYNSVDKFEETGKDIVDKLDEIRAANTKEQMKSIEDEWDEYKNDLEKDCDIDINEYKDKLRNEKSETKVDGSDVDKFIKFIKNSDKYIKNADKSKSNMLKVVNDAIRKIQEVERAANTSGTNNSDLGSSKASACSTGVSMMNIVKNYNISIINADISIMKECCNAYKNALYKVLTKKKVKEGK